uniref:Uncharacterized protein n=2 Tax=Panagrolaimus sp. PS1159 TaxID=55785 RepID=A0AC35GB18_9BILA
MPKKIQKTLTPAELLEAEKNSYRLFRFTATEITTRLTGIMIDTWTTVYNSHIAPALVDPSAPAKAVKKFSYAVLELLFQRGRFGTVFNDWKEYIAATIFRVPPLPEAADYDDQEDLDKEIEELEERIRQRRAEIEMVENERNNTRIAIEAIRAYKKAVADSVVAMEH